MNIVQLIVAALIVEALCETAKMTWQAGKVNWDRIVSMAIGILVAFGAKIDFLALVGLPLVIPYLGNVLTGLLISRGSNFLHDLWASIQSLSELMFKKANGGSPEAPPVANVVVKKIAKVLTVKKDK